MYRQILVHPKHTPYQKILFRTKDNELRDFELSTVTFGVNCAPFLAIRVLHQLSDDVRSLYPLASHIIANNMYVDDVLAGAHSKSTADQAIAELRKALESAGFPLRKWTSNEKDLLRAIPKDHLLRADFLEIEEACSAKTLGIRWKADTDEFFFAPSELTTKQSVSKREVLSQIAKLFDPAGWLGPVIIQAKIFMQEIWLQELGWDDPLPESLLSKWNLFLQEYPGLSAIRIPRWVEFRPQGTIQYHGFCDASQRAYGAAIYVRTEIQDRISVHLLTAKTRVAPVKTISLPRLELCGAALLSELSAALSPQLPSAGGDWFYWTDSTIVLAWLHKPPCAWTTFVANRVAKITQATDSNKWSHVRSEYNPADLASRGAPPQALVNNELWWHGPEWLRLPQNQWPIPSDPLPDTTIEQRTIKVNLANTAPSFSFLERFSKFDRALRVLAYIYRFVKRCKRLSLPSTIEIDSNEISYAQERLILLTQRQAYSSEYTCLSTKKQLTSSKLLNLNPFLDGKGIIRACGRVRAAEALGYDERHPIILPYTCAYSRLLTAFTHLISLHGGNQLMMRLIRSQYWIPKLKVLVKSTIHSCKICVIRKKKLQTQLMGDLPVERVTFSRPFTHTGVDFAGPFDVKNYTGRACLITKGYVCVFVCFSTKAIHLEATSDLTTEKFLAAFARFVARRGCPSQMHSDNGKTFVGAAKVLSRDFVEALKTQLQATYSLQKLSWHFNPPSAPHMGGLWEAGVKSFKNLFYKSTSTSKYTFEELSTLLSKVEACLNSRPISPMSEDPTDLLALTPGHFLVGGPLLSATEPEIKENAASIINRWQRLKALQQQFCLRWKHEYLLELHKRNKWQTPTRDLQRDDLVIIKEDNLPVNDWRLGRIQTTYPGDDQRVRVVDVLTARGVSKRPISKLILLPIESSLHFPSSRISSKD
ncbi:uncharacterized protein LOC135430171 [Drosophila montana]|uniref:uncharacterized protein LOC135430171 n=1 Tax=Drosophila montana TaxID=40370 RepID=UPI00313A8452